VSPTRALFRQALRDSRTRTLSFAILFAFAVGVQGPTYNATYDTLAERLELARTFGSNTGTRLLYGTPHDLLSTGGWISWRLGVLPILAALWGLFGAVRALRTEEESGRQELVLAGIVGRRTAFVAAMRAVGVGAFVLWLVTFLAALPAKVDVAGAAYLALALNSPALVFAGVGALTGQLAPTRRGALGLGGAALVVSLVLRMVADTSDPLSWLRWLTPFGWAEELRPFTGAQPLLLVPIALLSALLVVTAGRISERRDVGAGLFAARDSAPPRLAGLSSPAAEALRSQRGSLLAWLIGCSAIALLLGVLSATASEGISDDLNEQFQKLGTSLTSAEGFLGLEFLLDRKSVV